MKAAKRHYSLSLSIPRAVRFCHSTQPSSHSAAFPPSHELSLEEMDASLDDDDDDDDDDESVDAACSSVGS